MILGLDISTAVTGLALVSADGKIIDSKFVKTPTDKFDNLYAKAEKILSELTEFITDRPVTQVYIEEPLIAFSGGSSTGQTIALLQQYNGIISYVCYQLLSIRPKHINAGSARKLVGIKKREPKLNHSKSIKPIKIKVFEHLVATEPEFQYLTTRAGNVNSSEYDRADAIVVAKAGAVDCLRTTKN